jgi:flagellar motor component MotA
MMGPVGHNQIIHPITARLTMQPNTQNTNLTQCRSITKKSILSLFRRPQPSPLKQRMAEVLKQDRRAINDPYAHLKATYFGD